MSATDKQRGNRGKDASGSKNLKPWKKGQSGNPKGRPPKSASITTGLKEQLDKVPDFPDRRGDPNTKTWRDLIVDAILRGCLKGNHPLTKELLDRLEGKVKETHEVGGIKDRPVEVKVIEKVKDYGNEDSS